MKVVQCVREPVSLELTLEGKPFEIPFPFTYVELPTNPNLKRAKVTLPNGQVVYISDKDWVFWDDKATRLKVVRDGDLSNSERRLLEIPKALVHTCPHCAGSVNMSCDHLEVGAWAGSWFCPHCHLGIWPGRVSDDLVKCRPAPAAREGELYVPCWVLLRLYGKSNDNKAVHIVVASSALLSGTELQEPSTDAAIRKQDSSFHFNENTCPSNYLRFPIAEGATDSDPHGIFQFVQKAPVPKDFDSKHHSINQYLREKGWESVFDKFYQSASENS